MKEVELIKRGRQLAKIQFSDTINALCDALETQSDAQWNAAIQRSVEFVSDWAIEPGTAEYRIPLDIAEALPSLKKGPTS